MKSLTESKTAESKIRQLVWVYPDEEGHPFLLWDEGVKAGWIQFHEGPAESTTGEFRGQQWIFRYSANLHPKVTVYPIGSQEALAEFVPSLTGGGLVSFASGVRYRWKRADIWGGKWCFRRVEDGASVCLSQEAGPLTGRQSRYLLRGCRPAGDSGSSVIGMVLAYHRFRNVGGRHLPRRVNKF